MTGESSCASANPAPSSLAKRLPSRHITSASAANDARHPGAAAQLLHKRNAKYMSHLWPHDRVMPVSACERLPIYMCTTACSPKACKAQGGGASRTGLRARPSSSSAEVSSGSKSTKSELRLGKHAKRARKQARCRLMNAQNACKRKRSGRGQVVAGHVEHDMVLCGEDVSPGMRK